MTLAQILRLLARRWLVLLIGALATVGLAAGALQVTGVYTARTEIQLLPPADWAVAGNSFTESTATLVGFARAVEKTIGDSPTGQLFASADTPLFGSGVRLGELVYVPNRGGQWAPRFSRPELIIDVVGPDSAYVSDRVIALTEEISDIIDERQDEFDVADDQRITWQALPATPEVSYVGPSRLRVLAGIGALGVGLSLAAAFLVDVLIRRRRAEPRAH